jgi:hypothetical protein
MIVLGDVGGMGIVEISGTVFPSKRFEVIEFELGTAVPFTCPLDNCETSE